MEGSQTITLTLTMTALSAQVKDHTYYLGEALKSDPRIMELAAKVQASADDDVVLKDFIKEGSVRLSNTLARVLGKLTYSWNQAGDTITYTVNAVANFMSSQTNALQDTMLAYMSCYVLSKWLNLIKPDEATRFENMLAGYEEDLRQMGAQRSKPTRS